MAILISRSFSQCYAMLGAYEEYGRTLSSKTEQFEKYLDLKTQNNRVWVFHKSLPLLGYPHIWLNTYHFRKIIGLKLISHSFSQLFDMADYKWLGKRGGFMQN